MQLYENVEDFVPSRQPLVLTIGNFDGLHRGHQAVLQKVKALSSDEGETTVLTFRNHPSHVLCPEQPTKLLCTLPHKLRLLDQFGIHSTILLSFTPYLAQHSATSFLERIRQNLPFSHLVLGHDATLGRDRQGDPATLKDLGEQWGFNVHYLDEYRFEGHPISSTSIRDALRRGDLDRVETLLNRPYSIYVKTSELTVIDQDTMSTTFTFDTSGLCVPPIGKYEISVCNTSQCMEGVASWNSSQSLEVQFQTADPWMNLNEEALEIFFKGCLKSPVG